MRGLADERRAGRARWVAAAALAGGLGVALLGGKTLVALGRVQSFVQTGRASTPVCPFRARTGLPCLGCGGTRAMELAARGDLRGAWRQNPLGTWAGIVAWLTAACAALGVWSGNGKWLKRAGWACVATAPLAFVWTFVWWWRALPPGPGGP